VSAKRGASEVAPSRVGEQLSLELALKEAAKPWNGRSPRHLTEGFKRFILKAQAAPRMRVPIFARLGSAQRSKGPVYDGAPLLLPFEEDYYG